MKNGFIEFLKERSEQNDFREIINNLNNGELENEIEIYAKTRLSLPTEREIKGDGHFKTVEKPKDMIQFQNNLNQSLRLDGALWLFERIKQINETQ